MAKPKENIMHIKEAWKVISSYIRMYQHLDNSEKYFRVIRIGNPNFNQDKEESPVNLPEMVEQALIALDNEIWRRIESHDRDFEWGLSEWHFKK